MVEENYDKLNEIFMVQKKLQERLKVDFTSMSKREMMDYISKQWRNISVEFGEMMQLMPFKEWKIYKYDMYKRNKNEIEEEFIDIFHFFINMALVLGFDANKLHKMYMKKNKINFKRQENGYQ